MHSWFVTSENNTGMVKNKKTTQSLINFHFKIKANATLYILQRKIPAHQSSPLKFLDFAYLKHENQLGLYFACRMSCFKVVHTLNLVFVWDLSIKTSSYIVPV